jgi:hypothetical protein
MPRRTGFHRCKTTRRAVALHRRCILLDHRRIYSLAHQASARLNTLVANWPPCLSLKARRGTKAPAADRISGPKRPDNRFSRIVKAVPATSSSPGIGRRSGSKPPFLFSRALRWLRRAGKTLKSPFQEVPALHREAERDTTGNFCRQHVLHTWIDRPVQGSRQERDNSSGASCFGRHLANAESQRLPPNACLQWSFGFPIRIGPAAGRTRRMSRRLGSPATLWPYSR